MYENRHAHAHGFKARGMQTRMFILPCANRIKTNTKRKTKPKIRIYIRTSPISAGSAVSAFLVRHRSCSSTSLPMSAGSELILLPIQEKKKKERI